MWPGREPIRHTHIALLRELSERCPVPHARSVRLSKEAGVVEGVADMDSPPQDTQGSVAGMLVTQQQPTPPWQREHETDAA